MINLSGKYHEVETKIRRVDKRLALGFPIKDGTKKDEKNKKAILCNSEFPIGVRPGAVIPEHTRELRRMALNRHESLEYIVSCVVWIMLLMLQCLGLKNLSATATVFEVKRLNLCLSQKAVFKCFKVIVLMML